MRAAQALAAVLAILGGLPAAASGEVLVSRADGPGGRPARTGGTAVAVSRDGRFVLFTTRDRGLTATRAAAGENVYVRDTAAGRTELVSREAGVDGAPIAGCRPGGMAPDARYVTMACGGGRVIVRDRALGGTREIRPFPLTYSVGAPTSDGRYALVRGGDALGGAAAARVELATGAVAYVGDARGDAEVSDDGTLLFPTTGGHVLLRHPGGATEIADRDSRGEAADGPAAFAHLLPDGRHVIFASRAGNLDGCVDTVYASLYIRDLATGKTRLLSREGTAGDPEMAFPSASAGGRFVAYTTRVPSSTWPQVSEIVGARSVLSRPGRPPCPHGGGVPACLDGVTVTTVREQPLDLPSLPCTDRFGRPPAITVVSGPSHGELTPPFANGHRAYFPEKGFAGRDVVRYQASAGDARAAVAELAFDVTPRAGPEDISAPAVRWPRPLRRDGSGRVRGRLRCDEPCIVELRLGGRPRGFAGTTIDVTLPPGRGDRATGSVRDATGIVRALSERVWPRRARR